MPPLGFRAIWRDRARLARAKLANKLQPNTVPSDFAEILIGPNRASDKCDFVEVHIYEKVGRDAIEMVSGPLPADQDDRLLWKLIKRKLELQGSEVQER
jgi:hypothetical protein